MKRTREDEGVHEVSIKRRRPAAAHLDRLSTLSHELTLRILSQLTVHELTVCHRLSKHFFDLCGDSQLWKAHYYERFVRPRTFRIPGRKAADGTHDEGFSSKISTWLDEDKLVKRGRDTNWKRQYKLRENWSSGKCSVSEVAVSEEASIPPLLVQMHDSTIYMADLRDGLRAWDSAAGKDMLATFNWDNIRGHDSRSPPTSMSVDMSTPAGADAGVCVGFQDGSLAILRLDRVRRRFVPVYRQAASPNGIVTSTAFCFPHVATMTATLQLCIYAFEDAQHRFYKDHSPLDKPRLIHSLHSDTVHPPSTLSVRTTPTNIVISIAFALPTFLGGWTMALQEIHLDPMTSKVHLTRLASARSRRLTERDRPTARSQPSPSPADQQTTSTFLSRPTSISYTHPYLLASHLDNTLTLHMVSSTTDALDVGAGRVLWGHTSGVSGTTVDARGKAVSVTKRGDDVRLWDLEGCVAGRDGRGERVRDAEHGSVRIVPEPSPAPSPSLTSSSISSSSEEEADMDGGAEGRVTAVGRGGQGFIARRLGERIGRMRGWVGRPGDEDSDLSFARGWVAFDDESVVLLKERMGGTQSLVVYDFA